MTGSPLTPVMISVCNTIITLGDPTLLVSHPGPEAVTLHQTPPTDSRNLRGIIFIFDNEGWLRRGHRRMNASLQENPKNAIIEKKYQG